MYNPDMPQGLARHGALAMYHMLKQNLARGCHVDCFELRTFALQTSGLHPGTSSAKAGPNTPLGSVRPRQEMCRLILALPTAASIIVEKKLILDGAADYFTVEGTTLGVLPKKGWKGQMRGYLRLEVPGKRIGSKKPQQPSTNVTPQ